MTNRSLILSTGSTFSEAMILKVKYLNVKKYIKIPEPCMDLFMIEGEFDCWYYKVIA